MNHPANVELMRAVASAVIQSITVKAQNLPQYSFSQSITINCFPVPKSDRATATSADGCGATDEKNGDVNGWYPTLFTVKMNCW